ncbi:hypothetical protein BJV82DRAFT_674672 [Fennellomyces sp. T-0311]|nr:hypothetical protein BJV82DRAFT_674672 [Fennellomyces sp. T-0311]
MTSKRNNRDDDDDYIEARVPLAKRDRKHGKCKTKKTKERDDYGFSSFVTQVASMDTAAQNSHSEASNETNWIDGETTNDNFSPDELKRIEKEARREKHMRKKAEAARNWNKAINTIYPHFTDIFAEPGPAINATDIFPAEVKCTCINPEPTNEVTCVFLCNTVMDKKFHFCDDEKQSPIVTLLRHHMFSGSPLNPKVAFHIELLRAFDILKNISFISYEGFVEFVSSLQRKRVSSSIHRNFADAYNAYLMVKDLVDTDLQQIYELKEGDCVACPSAEEIDETPGNRLIITMDGNFGLKKTKKGEQPSAYHAKTMARRYFSADEKVAQYANNNEYNEDGNEDYCESFKNADPKRTTSSQSYFAINGVFGSLCVRHAVPQKFANIVSSGERYVGY